MRMNINEEVACILTQEGELVLEQAGETMLHPMKRCGNRYRTFQLHDLMRIFGKSIYNGGPIMFAFNDLMLIGERP